MAPGLASGAAAQGHAWQRGVIRSIHRFTVSCDTEVEAQTQSFDESESLKRSSLERSGGLSSCSLPECVYNVSGAHLHHLRTSLCYPFEATPNDARCSSSSGTN